MWDKANDANCWKPEQSLIFKIVNREVENTPRDDRHKTKTPEGGVSKP
jgi:hypothetical protein